MKKAAIYARVSSKKQKEEETIKSQIDFLLQYASKEGYFIPETWMFIDDGITGEHLQRPSLDEMRDMIRIEQVDAILIYAPDRLARKYSHQLILLEEFRKNGVKTFFIKDSHPTDTPEGIMSNHFQGIFAEYERSLIIDRSRRGRLFKAKQGNPSILPSVPYGYKKVKNGHNTVIEVVKGQSNIVEKIFKMYINDKISLSQIARTLSLEGIKSPKGLPLWDVTTIRNILKNPSYTGTAYFGKTKKIEKTCSKIRHYPSGKISQAKYSKVKLPEENWIPINIPQIINENDFELAQEQVKKNKEFAFRNTKEIALLQGIILCGKCGHPFYKRIRTYNGKTRGHYYCRSQTDKRLKKCSNSCIDQYQLDELVYNEVITLVSNPKVLQDELLRRSKEACKEEEIDRQEILLKKELSKIVSEQDRLLDAYQSGVLDLENLRERHQKLNFRRQGCEKEKNAIQAFRVEKQIDFGSLFESVLKKIQNSSNDLPLKEKQKLVRLLVEKVVVDEQEITVVHCVSPSAINQEICQLRGAGQKR
jgi:site-specific DNA recombinase